MCETNRFGIKIIGGIPEKQGELVLPGVKWWNILEKVIKTTENLIFYLQIKV